MRTFRPIVSCTGCAKNEIIRLKHLTVARSTYGIDRTDLKITQYRTWNVSATVGLIEVDVDSLKLQIRMAAVDPLRRQSVFFGHNLPELESRRKCLDDTRACSLTLAAI